MPLHVKAGPSFVLISCLLLAAEWMSEAMRFSFHSSSSSPHSVFDVDARPLFVRVGVDGVSNNSVNRNISCAFPTKVQLCLSTGELEGKPKDEFLHSVFQPELIIARASNAISSKVQELNFTCRRFFLFTRPSWFSFLVESDGRVAARSSFFLTNLLDHVISSYDLRFPCCGFFFIMKEETFIHDS
jgi:hypothetical protein